MSEGAMTIEQFWKIVEKVHRWRRSMDYKPMSGCTRIRNNMDPKIFLILLGVLAAAAITHAWIRQKYSDAEVVSRAELIVVGAVKEHSLSLVLDSENRGLPEHHLEIQVSEFLKGTNAGRTIPVCIIWGLTPVTGGYYSNRFQMLDRRWVNTNYPKEIIEIFDTGNSMHGQPPLTGDLRTNHIWLIRREGSRIYSCRSNLLSVYDPEDIQSLRRRVDLVKHLK